MNDDDQDEFDKKDRSQERFFDVIEVKREPR